MELYYFIVFACFSFAMGCCVASFMNVCIWRIPRGESVAWPPSHCPSCNAPIKWYQNVPIVSWLALRGRCANCRGPISMRYAVVELLGGILFLLAYLQWGMPFFLGGSPALGLMGARSLWVVPVYWLVATGLILGSFVDLDHQWIPDRVTIGGMVLGVPLSFLVPELQGERDGLHALYWSLGGMAFGFAFLWTVGFVFSKAFKKDAMGFGDVKLMGAVGAFFGPAAALFTIVVSSFVGAVAGLLLIARGKARLGGYAAVPYGPFLALGALAWMYWGRPVLDWYLKLNAFAQ